MPIKAWFCCVELRLLTVQRSPYTAEPWFRSLVESIRADGLMSPLIVDNRDKQGNKVGGMRVGVGMNRTRAMQELGWKECPAIVYGNKPQGHCEETFSLEAINEYLGDGEAYQTRDGGILLKNHHVPEKMVHPTNEEPYHGGETI